MKNLFKKGMKVKVRVGKDKGKTGEIIEINRFRDLAKVKDVNMQKKHKNSDFKWKKTNTATNNKEPIDHWLSCIKAEYTSWSTRMLPSYHVTVMCFNRLFISESKLSCNCFKYIS